MRARAVLVDGQSGFQQGLLTMSQQRNDVEILRATANLGEAITEISSRRPDVIVVDPETITNGDNNDASPFAEKISKLRKQAPDAPVAVLTSNNSTQALREAIVSGARGYMLKDDAPNDLFNAIVTVAQGGAVLSPRMPAVAFSVIDDLNARAGSGNEPLLTKREIDVLSLVAQGKTNRQIARDLYIADNTVKNHVRNILEKLGVHTRMEAVERASAAGVLSA